MYFILSSSCKAVKGEKRTLLSDYGRGEFYFISNDYYHLLKDLQKHPFEKVKASILPESVESFNEFLNFLLSKEMGFLHQNKKAFPRISEVFDEPGNVKDMIVEIDFTIGTIELFQKICAEIQEISCQNIQLRLLSHFTIPELATILEMLAKADVSYVEVHLSHNELVSDRQLDELVEQHARLSRVFVYGCAESSRRNVFSKLNTENQLQFGQVFHLDYEFDDGQCCGIINYEALSFNNVAVFNRLLARNGCLDKKIAIDRWGNIKNCPSMKESFGNVKEVSLVDIALNEGFRKYWSITKDQISVCKECEFRYCCSDCRAFRTTPDLYSKPLKCGYDPSTCKWDDQVSNYLKYVGQGFLQ